MNKILHLFYIALVTSVLLNFIGCTSDISSVIKGQEGGDGSFYIFSSTSPSNTKTNTTAKNKKKVKVNIKQGENAKSPSVITYENYVVSYNELTNILALNNGITVKEKLTLTLGEMPEDKARASYVTSKNLEISLKSLSPIMYSGIALFFIGAVLLGLRIWKPLIFSYTLKLPIIMMICGVFLMVLPNATQNKTIQICAGATFAVCIILYFIKNKLSTATITKTETEKEKDN